MVDGCFPTEEPSNLPDGAITPSELLQHLQNCHYWNYLDTNLLEDIINHVTVKGSPLRSLMAKYKKNVRGKVTCTLEECERKNVKPEPPPGYTTMAIEIDNGRSRLSFHLYQILQLKDLLVETFGVSDTLFAGFTEGSIVLYFYIPEEAVYSLCPKLEANCTVLEEQHVTTVVVFDHFSVDVSYQQMSLLGKVSELRMTLLMCSSSTVYTTIGIHHIILYVYIITMILFGSFHACVFVYCCAFTICFRIGHPKSNVWKKRWYS